MTKTESIKETLGNTSQTDNQFVLKNLLISSMLIVENSYNRNAYSEKSESEQKAFEDFVAGISKASKAVEDLFKEQ